MDSKVYYGEYSIKHWLDLILVGNVSLPKYQRSFVWKKQDVVNFVSSLSKKEFIPPVILGSFNKSENYIIDGQQRLSSILLAYLGKYPKKDAFTKADIILYADADDSFYDDEDANNDPIAWRFTDLIITKNETKESILRRITSNPELDSKYENLDVNIDSILENTYLGFSYIVPQVQGKDENEFYCAVFRNINKSGTPLFPQESRRSLYFLNKEKEDFFDWDGLLQYKVIKNNRPLDFIRYVAICSQYDENLNNINKIMKNYAPHGNNGKDEPYYEKYIEEAIKNEQNGIFRQFSSIFPESEYKARLSTLQTVLTQISFEKKYNSIVEADTYFFGLIYYVLIQNKKIDFSKITSLKKDLKKLITEYKIDNIENNIQEKNPNQLRFIRMRFSNSINVFKKYIK